MLAVVAVVVLVAVAHPLLALAKKDELGTKISAGCSSSPCPCAVPVPGSGSALSLVTG